jgi:UDP-GlcNAc:undecaprenyl-phosphate GlcNAc-1-phosphate transferase
MDDVYGLKAAVKLAFQIGAALILYAFGWRVETLGLPGIGAWPVGDLSLAITLAWVLLVTNALNLIDGLDGLACGLALVATFGVCMLLSPSEGPMLLAAAALAGALLGFLWFNLNPALIFMGDAGSLFVGFVLAAMTLQAGQNAGPGAFPLVPALLLAVPLFDTLLAIARRTRAAARQSSSLVQFLREVRARVFAPDGLHVHHRMVRSGLSTRRAVGSLWLVGIGFAAAACLMVRDPILGAMLLVGSVGLSWRGFAIVSARVEAAQPAPRALTLPVIPLAHAEPGEAAESSRRAA